MTATVPVPDETFDLPEATETLERACLGALLDDPGRVAQAPTLTEAHFAVAHHKLIYQAIRTAAQTPGKPDALMVMEILRDRGELRGVGDSAYLHTLISDCPVPGNVAYYATQVIEDASRREIGKLGSRLLQVANRPYAEALAAAHSVIDALDEMTFTPADLVIDGLYDVGEWAAQRPAAHDWLIPGLLERMERVLVVAGEGLGKSLLAAQVCLALSQGRHPFVPSERIRAFRTLIVDLENPPNLVHRRLKRIHDQLAVWGEWESFAHVWCRPAGLDLRNGKDAALLEQVIARCRPGLVALGPLYKAGFVAGEHAERTAAEVAGVLDRLRVRHQLSWWLEHHAPASQQGRREMRPFGSVLWARWPEFGLALERERSPVPGGPRSYAVRRFRGDRDERSWPDRLCWGSALPWEASWDVGVPSW